MKDKLALKGKFFLEQYRDGKLIGKIDITNAVTTVGKNAILDSYFNNSAPPTNWYFGLIDNAAFTGTAVTDTMSAHAGWTEFDDYTEANRQEWLANAASNAQLTNTTAATFTINATGGVRGAFIVSNNTKNGTTGILWSTGLFTSALAVVNTDVLKMTYTLGA